MADASLDWILEPTRRSILSHLAQGASNVNDLSLAIGREASNVSHHLRWLKDLGLVRVEAEGRQRIYHLADAELREFLEAADAVENRLKRRAALTSWGLDADADFHGYT